MAKSYDQIIEDAVVGALDSGVSRDAVELVTQLAVEWSELEPILKHLIDQNVIVEDRLDDREVYRLAGTRWSRNEN